MGLPEAKQDASHADPDDIDFAWDETFGVGSSAPNAGSTPPPYPRSGSGPSARQVSDPHAVAIDDLPDRAEARPREAMVTLPDDDPLRHDVGYAKDRDVTRDSMPTIPDINPLRHDVPELSEPELNDRSSGAGTSGGGGGRA